MSTPRHTPIPPEIRDAIAQKPADEQERLLQVWQLLGHLDEEDLADLNLASLDLEGVDTERREIQDHTLDVPDTESALADLEKAINRQEDVKTSSELRSRAKDRPAIHNIRSSKSRAMQWTTSAAGLFIALFVMMTWYWRAPVVIKAPLGEQITAQLPDNSTVTLNSGSRIEYARRFEEWPLIPQAKRRVFLQGEAFFDVEHSGKPFVVESFNAQVRVLGTTFNVWAREHDAVPETRVTLSSGTVLVTPHDNEKPTTTQDIATLDTPGDMVRVVTLADGATESLPDTVPVNHATAWRTRGFSAIDASVASIVSEIERRYNISIELDDALDASHTMTLFYQEKPTAEALIESICLSEGCQYRQTSTGFSIFPVGARE